MCKKNDDALFFTCSLIEYIGRHTKNKRSDIVRQIGYDNLEHLYEYSDIFHSEPIEKVCDDFIEVYSIKKGVFDNINNCIYKIPSYWDIGKVYERLIEDISNGDNVISTLIEVYTSFIGEYISDYNSAAYYQSREYIFESYKAETLL